MYRLVFLLTRDASTAEDLVQEAFVRLYAARERVDSANVESYLLSIVLNTVRTSSPRSLRRPEREAAAGLRDLRAAVPADDPASAAVDRESRERVEAALDSLSERQRLVTVCRYWLGYSDAETARATGMALGTVKTQLRRAQRRLRQELGGR